MTEPMQTRKTTSFSEADLFARQVSARLHTDRPAADVQVAWLSDYDSATRIGLRIAALDRELRRSAGAGPLTAPPPLLPGLGKGGLAFREGAPGSAELLFDVYGFVRDVVLSDPVLILTRAVQLAGAVTNVWGWFFPRDPLDRISAREALAVIGEYEKARATPAGAEPLGGPAPADRRGHTRVVISIANRDASRTIVMIEMD